MEEYPQTSRSHPSHDVPYLVHLDVRLLSMVHEDGSRLGRSLPCHPSDDVRYLVHLDVRLVSMAYENRSPLGRSLPCHPSDEGLVCLEAHLVRSVCVDPCPCLQSPQAYRTYSPHRSQSFSALSCQDHFMALDGLRFVFDVCHLDRGHRFFDHILLSDREVVPFRCSMCHLLFLSVFH